MDRDGTEVDGGREGVTDTDEDSVEYGSRVLRRTSASAREARKVNQTAGESSKTGSDANAAPTRKRARIDIEDLLSNPVESRPQPQSQPQPLPQAQEEEDPSPARKRQRTGKRGGRGGEGSNVTKKKKRS